MTAATPREWRLKCLGWPHACPTEAVSEAQTEQQLVAAGWNIWYGNRKGEGLCPQCELARCKHIGVRFEELVAMTAAEREV